MWLLQLNSHPFWASEDSKDPLKQEAVRDLLNDTECLKYRHLLEYAVKKNPLSSMHYQVCPKMMYRCSSKCPILNYAPIWLTHQAGCNRKLDLDEEIYFTNILNTILDLWVILLGSYFEHASQRIKILDKVYPKFQLRKMKAKSLLIILEIKRNVKNMSFTSKCTWVA